MEVRVDVGQSGRGGGIVETLARLIDWQVVVVAIAEGIGHGESGEVLSVVLLHLIAPAEEGRKIALRVEIDAEDAQTTVAPEKTGSDVLDEYARMTAVSANVRIAARCAKTGKSLEFIRRALAPCGSLDVDALAHAAVGGIGAVAEYLAGTDYADGAVALQESPAAFERWCDNLIMRRLQPQKYNPFTVGPLAAYLLARENEIKCVRMVLTGKLNGMPEGTIRERLREMYV